MGRKMNVHTYDGMAKLVIDDRGKAAGHLGKQARSLFESLQVREYIHQYVSADYCKTFKVTILILWLTSLKFRGNLVVEIEWRSVTFLKSF